MLEIILFGTGSGCKNIKSILNFKLVNVIAYADNDTIKQDEIMDGVPIINPKDIIKYNYDYVIIASMYFDSISKQLFNLGINEKKIICFYKEYTKIQEFYLKMLLFNKMFINGVEILVTGMSYGDWGIKADVLTNRAFNFALANQDLFYDYNIVKYLFEHKAEVMKSLKYVIIDLCYFSFEYDMSKSVVTKENIFRYQGILKNKHNYPSDEFENGYKKFADKVELYNGFIDDKKLNNHILNFIDVSNKSTNKLKDVADKNYFMKNGYFSWIDYEKDLNEKVRKQVSSDTHKNYPKTVEENKYIFDNYLQLLIRHNVKPIIVVLPTCKLYYNNYPNFMKKHFYDIIIKFKYKYGFQFLDYFDYDLFDDNDFADLSHLNAKGAEKMTGILNETVNW